MGINVYIRPDGQGFGFLLSVARLLTHDHNVIIGGNVGIKKLIQRVAPELEENVAMLSNYKPNIDEDEIVKECREREMKYGEYFSMISSNDRGLGKGYLFNADKHPHMERSWWGHEEKLRSMLGDFIYYEQIIDEHSPGVIISGGNNKIANLVARHQSIPTLTLTNAKLGDRYMWVENEYLHNTKLREAIARYLEHPSGYGDASPQDYEQVTASRVKHSRIDYSYQGALKVLVRRIIRESYILARSTASRLYRRKAPIRRTGYRFLGWIPPSVINKPLMFRYVSKHGVKPEELGDYRTIYFPLHLEPEVALMAVSPEFNNSMEAITWISKSLPADTLLVVKEQPFSFGIRSKHYYDNLRRIGNVVLADPTVHPWDWIKEAEFTATITGTAGVEAVYFGKPVLSFGKHQYINALPTVRYANNYESTQRGIQELLALDSDDELFKVSRTAVYRAQTETSFEHVVVEDRNRSAEPSPEDRYRYTELKPELARRAVAELYKQYPGVFKTP